MTPALIQAAALPLPALRAAFSKEDRRRRYWRRPDLWALDFVRWQVVRQTLTPEQLEGLAAFAEHDRQAIYGPHGIGKTTEAALLILWFADTRDQAGIDWKIPTTATAWRQLTKYLWPEVHKWIGFMDWEKLGRARYTFKIELLDLNLKLAHGEAFAVASNDHATIEGAHATQMLYIFDEAKKIPDKTFDASEGAFTGGSEAYAFAISTPEEEAGRFHAICARKPGYEDWHVRHVTKEQAIASGRMTQAWADQRLRQWGKDSVAYQNRVLGLFTKGSASGVIPLAWVEAAIERWLALEETGMLPTRLTDVGADFARGGGDQMMLAPRAGNAILRLRCLDSIKDTMPAVGVIAGLVRAHPGSHAIVDVIGIGAGPYDRLVELMDEQPDLYKHQGIDALPFNASAGCAEAKDRSGELGFINLRSAAWWALRERLDPEYDPDFALPPDDELIGDLTAPRWRVTSNGRIQVESKDDAFVDADGNKPQSLRQRLGRSTDRGDAAVMAAARELLRQLLAQPTGLYLSALPISVGSGASKWRDGR